MYIDQTCNAHSWWCSHLYNWHKFDLLVHVCTEPAVTDIRLVNHWYQIGKSLIWNWSVTDIRLVNHWYQIGKSLIWNWRAIDEWYASMELLYACTHCSDQHVSVTESVLVVWLCARACTFHYTERSFGGVFGARPEEQAHPSKTSVIIFSVFPCRWKALFLFPIMVLPLQH